MPARSRRRAIAFPAFGALAAAWLLAAGASAAPPAPIPADVALHLGPSVRLGDAPDFSIVDRAGASIGVSIFVAPWSRFAIGLGYEHTGLGNERGGAGDLDRVEVSRAMDSLIASLRMHLYEGEIVRLSAEVGPGLAWQSASAAGLVPLSTGSYAGVRCSATSGPDLLLRAGLGAEVLLGSGVSFVAGVTLDNARLGSDAVGECIPGAGTVTLFGARAGFAYRFDDLGRYLR
ncbi:MAG: hypothetical protein U0359_30075 [Byssovorax sp.]